MLSTKAIITCVITSIVAVIFIWFLIISPSILEHKKVIKIHKLEFPLMLTGSGIGGRNYFLPKGISLYYEQSFPEGFNRYKIYVNVEGIDLPSQQQSDSTLIDPISAYPIGSIELRKLLSEYPLSKDELASILRSGGNPPILSRI